MDTYDQSFPWNDLKSRDRRVLGYHFITMLVCLIKLVMLKSAAPSRNQSIIAKPQSNKIVGARNTAQTEGPVEALISALCVFTWYKHRR